LNVSPWPGGAPAFPPDPNRINRAECKLLEALETFRIQLCPRHRALDLGASPGGWTRILVLHGLTVTAVDPQPLLPEMFFHPSVTHVPLTAEAMLEDCPEQFDFIANDMVLAAQDSARLMVAYAKHLRPGGMAIMTLKLPLRDRCRVMDHCFRILRKAYRIPRVRQLYYNRSEVTAWLKKGPELQTRL
jgi:23S rRNA (cytidine2498-2'-O)-methyltransferase